MATVYQLVAWTENGRLRMIPSEIHSFMQNELEGIKRLSANIGYGTWHEVRDILRVSRAYEKLGLWLIELGRNIDAFNQFVAAAQCCLWCTSECWEDTDEGEILCSPLRGRFFAMFGKCKELTRSCPNTKRLWKGSGLQESVETIFYGA